ncbi:hypothetical protein ACFY04_12205 [Streptomyces sp. NPDC001549]|uniref:hypothetical protein n=1 Tax=Streptomyces sp. NPDC001549 TaxID=3364586 RepID=UPI00369365B3
MTNPSEGERGRVLYDCMHPLRQRECMNRLLCQVCAKPAETSTGTMFLEWQRPGEGPKDPTRITTDMPPVCSPCLPLSLRHCPFLPDEKTAVLLLVRKSVLSGVSGTLYRIGANGNGWTTSERDVYSSFNKPRYPGMLAQRLHRKLRGVTVMDPDSLPAEVHPTHDQRRVT